MLWKEEWPYMVSETDVSRERHTHKHNWVPCCSPKKKKLGSLFNFISLFYMRNSVK